EKIKRYMLRPSEELYDVQNDPYQFSNLAGSADLQSLKQQLSEQLDLWLKEEKDPGLVLDTLDVHQAAKKVEHRF
ncbi:MAG: heparan N-sulfatase, partial [Verrucomicrobiota bacterium]